MKNAASFAARILTAIAIAAKLLDQLHGGKESPHAD